MAGKRNAPQIRFAGFAGTWERRTIGECFTERMESQPDGELLSVTIHHGVKRFSELDRQDSSNSDKSRYKKVSVGDIAYNTMRMWQGASGCSPYEGIVSPAYTVLSPNPGINSQCFAYHFKLADMIHTFQINSQGITSDNWNLKFSTLSGIEIAVSPEAGEQERLAAFFSRLDRLVGLSRDRYERLLRVQKSTLEKLFPQEGEDVPRVRFREFAGPWARVELARIADNVTEKNTQNLVTETFTNSAEHGIISQREFFDHDVSRAEKINGYYLVKPQDFVYNPRISVTAPCGPVNCNRLGRSGVMSPLYTVFRTHDVDTLFLEWYFKSPHWYPYMRFNGDSGARSDRFSIKNELFFKMPIPLPGMEEQRRTGRLLQALSDTMKLYRQEFETLQVLKKALLEKMFV